MPREDDAEGTVSLRDVTDGDDAFLFAVYASTRAAELAMVDWNERQKDAFVRQQFEAQRSWYERTLPGMTCHVIVVDGDAAGRLYLDARPKETCVVDIAVLPGYQRRGAGSAILARVQDQAAARGANITLQVERFNPALAWYLRRGFVVVADDGSMHLSLCWAPPTPGEP